MHEVIEKENKRVVNFFGCFGACRSDTSLLTIVAIESSERDF